jgi:hypothetical protein
MEMVRMSSDLRLKKKMSNCLRPLISSFIQCSTLRLRGFCEVGALEILHGEK